MALDAWLRTHEAEESTLEGYRGYVRRTIRLALGQPRKLMDPEVAALARTAIPVSPDFRSSWAHSALIDRIGAGQRVTTRLEPRNL